MMMEEVAFVPWEALSCLALTLKLCRPIVPSADCTTSVAGVYLAKRRTANHPCPVCGKHYVNEGSLRKHLACHPETSQLSTSLRMWPCSVCQAVFTHESGKYNLFFLKAIVQMLLYYCWVVIGLVAGTLPFITEALSNPFVNSFETVATLAKLTDTLYRDRFTLLLRFIESHGAHENGPEASVRGAIRFKSRRRREAGERNPRIFESRYEVTTVILSFPRPPRAANPRRQPW